MVPSATPAAPSSLPTPPPPATARAHHQAALTHLVARLARLVQEMGDRGLEPDVFSPARELRPAYAQLSAEALRLIERLGAAPSNPSDHLANLLVARLRSTTRTSRREQMSLQQALGETLRGGG